MFTPLTWHRECVSVWCEGYQYLCSSSVPSSPESSPQTGCNLHRAIGITICSQSLQIQVSHMYVHITASSPSLPPTSASIHHLPWNPSKTVRSTDDSSQCNDCGCKLEKGELLFSTKYIKEQACKKANITAFLNFTLTWSVQNFDFILASNLLVPLHMYLIRFYLAICCAVPWFWHRPCTNTPTVLVWYTLHTSRSVLVGPLKTIT